MAAGPLLLLAAPSKCSEWPRMQNEELQRTQSLGQNVLVGIMANCSDITIMAVHVASTNLPDKDQTCSVAVVVDGARRRTGFQ